jgi:hypothetical protein
MTTSSVRQFAMFLTLGAVSATVNWASRFAYPTAMPFSAAIVSCILNGHGNSVSSLPEVRFFAF